MDSQPKIYQVEVLTYWNLCVPLPFGLHQIASLLGILIYELFDYSMGKVSIKENKLNLITWFKWFVLDSLKISQ